MPKQVIIRGLRCVALVWSIAGITLDASPSIGQDRPNILFFLGDNWSWPHASALGDPSVKTPVFDRCVREGALVQHAFCPVPSCSPTRSCILTGRASHQLEAAASLWSEFPRKLHIFTDILEQAGYQVGYCGKGWSPGRYLQFGWEHNPVGKEYPSFAEFMAMRDVNKPFFFWNGNTDTALYKWKYEPEHWQGIDPASIRVPHELPDCEPVRADISAYYGSVQRIDQDAGRCLQELESRALLDATMVIYTSDNGWQMPRGLANCYDSGTRVPMAVRWPPQVDAGRRVDDFVSLTDLAPTFLEAAGLPMPREMTGRSFLGSLRGEASFVQRDHVFIERERHANVRRGNLSYPVRGVRTQDYLYLWNLRPDRWPAGDPKAYMAVGDYGDVDGSRAKEFMISHAESPAWKKLFALSFAKRPAEELYDLETDPRQWENVAGLPKYAAVKRELRAKVEQWMRDTDDPRTDPQRDDWDEYPYFGGRVVDENGNPVTGKARLPK